MDVTEQTFATAVLERSYERPVVVDFWAEWCGPCRQLGPTLERAAAAHGADLDLVKVDTDANPGLARSFQIQGIPAVKAFRDGKVVAEFVGNQSPAFVEQFLGGLVPSEADRLIALGDEASLRRAAELAPSRPDAILPLARIALTAGDRVGARELAARLPGNFGAEGLLARLRLEEAAGASAPGSPDQPLTAAFAALDAGEPERGLDLLLAAIADADADDAQDDLRKVIVGVLDELGPSSELARDARRRLASALY